MYLISKFALDNPTIRIHVDFMTAELSDIMAWVENVDTGDYVYEVDSLDGVCLTYCCGLWVK